jgi:integrase
MSVLKDELRETWYVSVRINNKQHKKRGFKTRAKAKEYERKLLQNGLDEVILFDDVLEHFLFMYESKRKTSSIRQMNSTIRNHIKPYFHNKDIAKITNKNIIDWQLQLNSKGYSFNHKKTINTKLSAIFAHAVKYYNLKGNPCTAVGGFERTESKKEMLFWTHDEYKNFRKNIKNLKDQVTFDLLFYTGLRLGELLGLTWQDVNLDFKSIDINKQIQVNGSWELTSLKTASSNRIIRIDNNLVELLSELKKGASGEFVLGSDVPLSKSDLWRSYKAYLELCDNKQIRIHDFRHSNATFLISLGADIFMIAKRLGHADKVQVFNTYGHLYPEKEYDIIDKINSCCHTVATKPLETKKTPISGGS